MNSWFFIVRDCFFMFINILLIIFLLGFLVLLCWIWDYVFIFLVDGFIIFINDYNILLFENLV